MLVLAGLGSGARAGSSREHGPQTRARIAQPRFATAVADPALLWSPSPRRGLDRVRAAGATAFRLNISWARIAPAGTPRGFDAADPADPHYHWRDADRMIRLIVARGLDPIVCIMDAPAWAEDTRVAGPAGTRRPNPVALGLFAQALAKRYSGGFRALPRVRYWQIWNEPNHPWFLNPQLAGGRPVAATWYRRMLNQAAAAIHTVQPDAAVIGGSLAPFGSGSARDSVQPLKFMRTLLCVSGGRRPRATCSARTSFDIWSHHPYTAGGPDHHAFGKDNVSVADLPKMRRVLLAALRAGHVESKQTMQFWVTEFGWDSDPPDPAAVPQRLEARWISEALYRMWRFGVSLVTWYQLRDDPLGRSFAQTGLYFDDGPRYLLNRPKLALAAFRFPFVAYKRHGRVLVWGRAPNARGRYVVVERRNGRQAWTRVRVAQPEASGVFSALLRAPLRGSLRARLPGGPASLPFSLKRPRGLVLPSPFGN